jgi:hypothetical protein
MGAATVSICCPLSPPDDGIHEHDLANRLAHVAGTQEPVYGPSAIKSVAEEAKETPYSEIKREDLKWSALDTTCVETQCFYIFSDDGRHACLAQVIYSNVA